MEDSIVEDTIVTDKPKRSKKVHLEAFTVSAISSRRSKKPKKKELYFRAGEEIVITASKHEGGMYFGQLKQDPTVQGWFPAYFVPTINPSPSRDRRKKSLSKNNSLRRVQPSDALTSSVRKGSMSSTVVEVTDILSGNTMGSALASVVEKSLNATGEDNRILEAAAQTGPLSLSLGAPLEKSKKMASEKSRTRSNSRRSLRTSEPTTSPPLSPSAGSMIVRRARSDSEDDNGARDRIITTSGPEGDRIDRLSAIRGEPMPKSLLKMNLTQLMEKQKTEQPSLEVPIILDFFTQRLRVFDGCKLLGMFRIPGNETTIDAVWQKLENGVLDDDVEDPFVCASIIKRWIINLPEPIFPGEHYARAIARASKGEECVEYLAQLPRANRNLVMYLIRFLQNDMLSVENQSINKMDIPNLAIIFGPVLLNNPRLSPTELFQNLKLQSLFVHALLVYGNGFGTNASISVYESACAEQKRQARLGETGPSSTSTRRFVTMRPSGSAEDETKSPRAQDGTGSSRSETNAGSGGEEISPPTDALLSPRARQASESTKQHLEQYYRGMDVTDHSKERIARHRSNSDARALGIDWLRYTKSSAQQTSGSSMVVSPRGSPVAENPPSSPPSSGSPGPESNSSSQSSRIRRKTDSQRVLEPSSSAQAAETSLGTASNPVINPLILPTAASEQISVVEEDPGKGPRSARRNSRLKLGLKGATAPSVSARQLKKLT